MGFEPLPTQPRTVFSNSQRRRRPWIGWWVGGGNAIPLENQERAGSIILGLKRVMTKSQLLIPKQLSLLIKKKITPLSSNTCLFKQLIIIFWNGPKFILPVTEMKRASFGLGHKGWGNIESQQMGVESWLLQLLAAQLEQVVDCSGQSSCSS